MLRIGRVLFELPPGVQRADGRIEVAGHQQHGNGDPRVVLVHHHRLAPVVAAEDRLLEEPAVLDEFVAVEVAVRRVEERAGREQALPLEVVHHAAGVHEADAGFLEGPQAPFSTGVDTGDQSTISCPMIRFLLVTLLSSLPLLASLPLAAADSPPNILFIAVDDLNDWVGHLGRAPADQDTQYRSTGAAGRFLHQSLQRGTSVQSLASQPAHRDRPAALRRLRKRREVQGEATDGDHPDAAPDGARLFGAGWRQDLSRRRQDRGSGVVGLLPHGALAARSEVCR